MKLPLKMLLVGFVGLVMDLLYYGGLAIRWVVREIRRQPPLP